MLVFKLHIDLKLLNIKPIGYYEIFMAAGCYKAKDNHQISGFSPKVQQPNRSSVKKVVERGLQHPALDRRGELGVGPGGTLQRR